MDKELLNRAIEINGELDNLERAKSELESNAHPEGYFQVRLNQCYGDFGKSFTNQWDFKGDIAREMYDAIMSILEAHIAKAEKQLAAL